MPVRLSKIPDEYLNFVVENKVMDKNVSKRK